MDSLNEINRVIVLIELPKCIVTSDQVISAKIIIDMLNGPEVHQIIAYSRSLILILVLTRLQRIES